MSDPVSSQLFAHALLIIALTLFFASSVSAQSRQRSPASLITATKLQPFTLEPSHSSTRDVGYYAPHAERSTSSFEPNDDVPSTSIGSTFRGESGPMVNGSHAVLRNGVAYAPSNAPDRVKRAIWAVNTIRRKPYVWGGGHGSFYDRGYDCSGTVSFALHNAGLLGSPLPSSDLMRYGERGRGRWFTIYSRRGHTFAMIAGLRLDTTDFRYGGDVGPRWHNDFRDTRGFVATHPIGL